MGDVGGNSLGFYGCAFSPCGNAVLSHGFQGAFHFWKFSDNQVLSFLDALQLLPSNQILLFFLLW